jgi:hypothetical protein
MLLSFPTLSLFVLIKLLPEPIGSRANLDILR